eukprot:m.265509 g.265509  ORF g.265509 m.265509 type:complete len:954 (+) comp16237_c0_seq12:215-3076(+)
MPPGKFWQADSMLEEGIAEYRKLAKFLTQYQHLTMEHTSKVYKLITKTGFNTIPPGGVAAATARAAHGIAMMATENEKLATEIAATASAIEKDAEELDWAHKRLKSNLDAKRKLIQDEHGMLQLARSALEAKEKECASSEEYLANARVGRAFSRRQEVKKHQEKRDAAYKKTEELRFEIKAAEKKCEASRSKFEDGKQEGIEKMEKATAYRYHQQINALKKILAKAIQVSKTIHARLLHDDKIVNDCDMVLDLQQGIQRASKKTGSSDLPATEVQGVAFRAHTRYWSDRGCWESGVFLLLQKSSKIWLYDKEHSTKPQVEYILLQHPSVVRRAHPSLFPKEMDSISQNIVRISTNNGALYCNTRSVEETNRWIEAIRQCPKCQFDDNVPRMSKRLNLTISEARNLPSAQYYAVVLINGEHYGRTRLSPHATDKPLWAAQFEFTEIFENAEMLTILILKHTKTSRRDPFSDTHERAIASLDVTLANGSRQMEESWYMMASTTAPECAIRMTLIYYEHTILPVRDYDKLKDLLDFQVHPDAIELIKAVESREDFKSNARFQFCQTLLPCSPTFHYLFSIIELEAAQTKDPNTLFRGNSIASCTIDHLMKLLTIQRSSYLVDTLGAIIKSVYKLKTAFEVDPTRVPRDDHREANLSKLQSASTEIWKAIHDSIKRVPKELRLLFHGLSEIVGKKFPALRHKAVSSFFFLRLVCPAILGPQLFGLHTKRPEEHVARTLTLLSKAIQNLANGVMFGSKEQYLIPMNKFITSNQHSMEQCLVELCSELNDNPNALDIFPMDPAEKFSAVHRVLSEQLKYFEEYNKGLEPKHCQYITDLIQCLKEVNHLVDTKVVPRPISRLVRSSGSVARTRRVDLGFSGIKISRRQGSATSSASSLASLASSDDPFEQESRRVSFADTYAIGNLAEIDEREESNASDTAASETVPYEDIDLGYLESEA